MSPQTADILLPVASGSEVCVHGGDPTAYLADNSVKFGRLEQSWVLIEGS